MIEYATRRRLLNLVEGRTALENLILRESAETRSPAGATFLSHSSKDEELVVGAIELLERHGATVYVDKKDPSLPPYTSKETANGLKERLAKAGKFVLLASPNSKDSRWVPWELGLADGYKGMRRVAILPTVEAQGDRAWASREYLGIYDRVVFGDHQSHAEKVWMVLDERANTATELSAWLAR